MRSVMIIVLMLGVTTIMWGCDEDGDKVICKPNETRTCQCATGGAGIEGCSSDGTAWSPCYCTGDGDVDTDVADQTDTADTVDDTDSDQVDTIDTTDDIDTDPADTVDTVDNTDTSVCSDGAKQCQGTSIFACLNNDWSFLLDCAENGQICQNGQCVAAPDGDEDPVDTNVCSNGEQRCIGNILFACQSGEWRQQEDCGDSFRVCSDGMCTCTSGETRCQQHTVQTCSNNTWQDTTNCAQQDETCHDGACACIDGHEKCVGTVLHTCYNNDWNSSTYDCAGNDEVCHEGECVQCYGDMKMCWDDELYRCDVNDYYDNTWEFEEDCSDEGKACVDGACVSAP